MRFEFFVPVALAAPLGLAAQQPVTKPPHADSTQRADSLLRPPRLHAVNIVATPADREEPASATHVGGLVIRLTPATSTTDLLRQTAGLEVHQQGQGPGFASDVSVRGFSSDHSTDLALWIDGVPVNEPVNGHAEGYNDWSALFPAGIQDIDVIKGPTSALFGNFALAGVVNVRTLDRVRGSDVSVSAGSFGRAEGTVLTGFDHGARGGGVFGLHFQREDGFRPNAGFNLGQAHARVVHDLTPAVRIDAGAEVYGTTWNSAGFLSEAEFGRRQYGIVSNPSDGGIRQRAQERVSLRVLAGPALWRTTVYSTQTRWQLFLTIPPAGGRFEGSGSQTEEIDHRHGYGLTSAVTWPLARGEATVGTEGRWDQTHYENYFTTARTRDSVNQVVAARQLSGALFLQSHTDVSDRIRVDVGGRVDALTTRSAPAGGGAPSSGSHTIFTPKVGALFRLTRAVAAYGNVSRGFRATDGTIANPSLPLITEMAYETGLKLGRGLTTLSAALFRMNVSNEQTFNPLSSGSVAGGGSRRQGLELEWRAPVGRALAVSADWTFNDARYTKEALAPAGSGPSPIVLDGLRVYNSSKYVGSAALDLVPPAAGWRLRASANFVGPYSPFNEPGVVLPPYGLLHLSGAATVYGTEIDVGVRNLLDRAYPELVAGHIVSPGQPRALYAAARHSW